MGGRIFSTPAATAAFPNLYHRRGYLADSNNLTSSQILGGAFRPHR